LEFPLRYVRLLDFVNILKVWALCLQTSALFSNPQKLHVHIDLANLGKDRVHFFKLLVHSRLIRRVLTPYRPLVTSIQVSLLMPKF